MRVLVVEDHAVDQQLICALLRCALPDVRLTEAGSLQGALRHVGAQIFDLVVLDLNLPDSLGIDTVRRMVHAVPDLPVVVLTGDIDEDLGLEAIAHGAQDFLAKAHLLVQRTGLERVLLRRVVRHAVERHRLRRESRFDPLTGVHNRRGLIEVLDREVERCARTNQPICALLIDCDDFKTVNDQFGYDSGDRLLKTIARCALATIRPSDVVARYGGDEFVILLPGLALDDAQGVAERLRRSVARHGVAWSATISIGVIEVDPAHPELRAIIEGAQGGLRDAKTSGKNVVSLAPRPHNPPSV